MTDAVIAEGLVKRYGDVTALGGVDLTVPSGTVLGLLGPNGAGKTTTMQMLTGNLAPTGGEVRNPWSSRFAKRYTTSCCRCGLRQRPSGIGFFLRHITSPRKSHP